MNKEAGPNGESAVPAHVLKEATHRHYKGGYYKVIGVAKHTETNDNMVVYEHIYPHNVLYSSDRKPCSMRR